MKIVIYSLTVLACLTSCKSGSDSSGPAKSQEQILQEAASAKDYSAQVTPNSFTLIKANMTSDEQKEKYTIGCKTEGVSYPSLNEVDRSLQVGQIFKSERAGSRLLEDEFYNIEESIVTLIEPNKISYDQNYEHFLFGGIPFTDVNQVFSHKPHMKQEFSYSVTPNGFTSTQKTVEMNLTPAAIEYMRSRIPVANRYMSCTVEFDAQSRNSDTVDKIFYNINGRNVVAYLEKRISEGNITCSVFTEKNGEMPNTPDYKVAMGRGHTEYTVISTNDLVESGIAHCGGVEVFRLSKEVLDSGKVLSTYLEKTLSAPER